MRARRRGLTLTVDGQRKIGRRAVLTRHQLGLGVQPDRLIMVFGTAALHPQFPRTGTDGFVQRSSLDGGLRMDGRIMMVVFHVELDRRRGVAEAGRRHILPRCPAEAPGAGKDGFAGKRDDCALQPRRMIWGLTRRAREDGRRRRAMGWGGRARPWARIQRLPVHQRMRARGRARPPRSAMLPAPSFCGRLIPRARFRSVRAWPGRARAAGPSRPARGPARIDRH